MTTRRLPVPSLHLITNRRRLAPQARTTRDELRALEALVGEAIAAGIDVVQVRERDLDGGPLFEIVRRAVQRADGSPTRILVNERADVAAAAGAHGVHLPGTGMTADRVRTLVPGWLVGRSVHGDEQPADAGSCDYLIFGTVFPSASKAPGSATAGLAGLRRAVEGSDRPVVAIGGIGPDEAAACIEAGAAGIAAIGAFLPDGPYGGVQAAVRAFREAMKHGPGT